MLKSEGEKMASGELYNSMSEELIESRLKAKEQIKRFNEAGVRETQLKRRILEELFGSTRGEFYIEQPFFCTYGYNIHWGKNAYANYNLTILDCGKVEVGDNAMMGPGVQLLTACHPLDKDERNAHIEFTRPIKVGDNVWIGGGAIILPGVTIGENSVIGAGSVVTKDIPDNVVAAGNPCKVIREITAEDKIYNIIK